MSLSKFRTLELAKIFYRESRSVNLRPVLRDQFERAVTSICLNLAEGSAKPSDKERAKFYRTALESLREAQIVIEIADRSTLATTADRHGAHLYRLCKSI